MKAINAVLILAATLTEAFTTNPNCPGQAPRDPKPDHLRCNANVQVTHGPRRRRNLIETLSNVADIKVCATSCANSGICASIEYDSAAKTCTKYRATGGRMGVSPTSNPNLTFSHILCFEEIPCLRILVSTDGTSRNLLTAKPNEHKRPTFTLGADEDDPYSFWIIRHTKGMDESQLVNVATNSTAQSNTGSDPNNTDDINTDQIYLPDPTDTTAPASSAFTDVKDCGLFYTSGQLILNCQAGSASNFYGCDDGRFYIVDGDTGPEGCYAVNVRVEQVDDD